jgi:hypothetical protein
MNSIGAGRQLGRHWIRGRAGARNFGNDIEGTARADFLAPFGA